MYPLPWQFPQTSRRAIFSFITPPRIAVQNGTLTWYSRSLPGSGPSSAASPRPPPVKMLEKISRNPPLPHSISCARRRARLQTNRKNRSRRNQRCLVPPGCRPPGKPPPKSPAPPRLAAAARVRLRRGRIDIVGIEPELVVNLSLLGIAENVVGLGKSLELLFRGLVARIDVRMILARKLAKRLADVVGGGRLLYPENAVIVFIFSLGGHGLAVSTQQSASALHSSACLAADPS